MSCSARIVPYVVLASLFVPGCGRSSGSNASSSPLEQACLAYANIYRQREANCYGVAAEPDQSTVITRETEACVLNSSAPGSATGASYWDTCAAAADNNCRAYECATYPLGGKQVGESCLVSLQCATLLCQGTQVTDANGAVLPNGIQCGTCAVRLAEGSPCVSAIDVCDVGMSCFQGACRVQGQAGAPCAVSNDCNVPTLVCRSSGTCGTVEGLGQTCASSSDCTTNEGCDPIQKVCVPFLFGQPGATCDGDVSRCESGACNKETGTCPTVLPDGALCDPNSGSTVCQVYARCFAGVCQIPDPTECG
jgi:hypothetical protein